jgi:hypothetical protein
MHFQLSDALRKSGLQQLVLVMKLSDFIGPFMQPRTFAWKRDFVQSKQDALLTWAIGYSLASPITACYSLDPDDPRNSIVLVDCAVDRQVGPPQW